MAKTPKLLLAILFVFLLPAAFLGHGLGPAAILKPATNSWPTYAGDYSQRRYSILTQINRANIHNLTLAWVNHLTAGVSDGAQGMMAFLAGSSATI
jgi:alcohol dehydrogenase (cytochrome c)